MYLRLQKNNIPLLLFLFQVRGHQRASSDSKEFHEVTKRDAQTHFEQELDKLLETLPKPDQKHFYKNEMTRFSSLFGRFLQEEGPSVEWDRIEKLPSEAVINYTTLKAPSSDEKVKDVTLINFCQNIITSTKNY